MQKLLGMLPSPGGLLEVTESFGEDKQSGSLILELEVLFKKHKRFGLVLDWMQNRELDEDWSFEA